MKKRLLAVLMIIVTVIVMAMPQKVDAATKIKLNKTKATLVVGESYQLKLAGASDGVTWKTSDKKIVTVDNGKIEGISEGEATVTATYKKKKYKCTVTVQNAELNKQYIKMVVGEEYKLEVTGTTKKAKWKTTSKNVQVDSEGNVTAKKTGLGWVYAWVGNKKFRCKINVFADEEAREENIKQEKAIKEQARRAEEEKKRRESFSETDAKRLISSEIQEQNGIVIRLESDYELGTTVKVKCTYYDENGFAIDKAERSVNIVQGDVAEIEFGKGDKALTYSLEYEYTYCPIFSLKDNIELTTYESEDRIVVYLKNIGEHKCAWYSFQVFFYNEENEVIYSGYDCGSSLEAEDTAICPILFPTFIYEDGVDMGFSFDHYEIVNFIAIGRY